MVPYTVFVHLGHPFSADELPVGHKALYTPFAEQAYKTLYRRNAFRAVGVAPLVRHGEQQREGHAPVSHPEHEYIDIVPPELPVRAVYGKYEPFPLRQQGEHRPCDKVAVHGERGDETLDAPERRIGRGRMVEGVGRFRKADPAHFAERTDEVGDKLDPCQVQLSLEMCIQYCRQFVIFSASIGFPH